METFCFVETLWSSLAVEVYVLKEGKAPVLLYQLLVCAVGISGSGISSTIFAETGLMRLAGMTFPGNCTRTKLPLPSRRVVDGSKIGICAPVASTKRLKSPVLKSAR